MKITLKNARVKRKTETLRTIIITCFIISLNTGQPEKKTTDLYSEACLEPSRASKMELFLGKYLTAGLVSEYASVFKDKAGKSFDSRSSLSQVSHENIF